MILTKLIKACINLIKLTKGKLFLKTSKNADKIRQNFLKQCLNTIFNLN
ncbi:MAG: hypothetical protein ACI9VT_003971 [Psychroserpens sp.]|jgi:hypothetical protein